MRKRFRKVGARPLTLITLIACVTRLVIPGSGSDYLYPSRFLLLSAQSLEGGAAFL
jgi:hypothetical protein